MKIARLFTFAFSLMVVGCVAAANSDSANITDQRPNIVLVLIDDLGWADLSCFGSTEASTPNIDTLAAEGIRFHQFYVNSPICSPSRVAVSTGRYPHRHRITSYLAHRALNDERGVANWLNPEAPMLARFLKSHGYATGHFGKWHMGGQRDVADAPPIESYGFDQALTNFEGMGAKLLPLIEKRDKQNNVVRDRIWADAEILGKPFTWTLRSKITGGFVDAALDFINRARANTQPFYINLWPDDVHGPWFPSIERWSENKRTRYLAVLEEMDRQLAPLFNRIKNDPALRNNTLVLFCSDNGPEAGVGSVGGFRGSKATLFEGGVRSPLIVWGPGVLAEGRSGYINKSSIFCAMDLVPSLLKIAGAPQPAGVVFDGEDISATLTGYSTRSRTAPIYFRRPPDRENFRKHKGLPDLAVRDGKWKLLCDLDGSNSQLYDIDKNPGEDHNLSEKMPELAGRLTRSVIEWNETMPQDAVAERLRIAAKSSLNTFVNPIFNGADPCVVKDGGRYLLCSTGKDREIALQVSRRLDRPGRRHRVWRAPAQGPLSRQIWAPELFKHEDRWYIYFAASDGENRNHRAYVLASESADPLGGYQLHGPLYTGEHHAREKNNLWAIDMTVFRCNSKLYAIWSGWPDMNTDLQHLYIAPMASPVRISGNRVKICANNDYAWEHIGDNPANKALNEAPQILRNKGRLFLVYSCSAAWHKTYKLGMLELTGDNPLSPECWKKFDQPVFQSTPHTYGVGHGSFTLSPDESQWWHVYHAKLDARDNFRRAVFIQPMHWSADGLPQFGKPVSAGTPLALPSGTK